MPYLIIYVVMILIFFLPSVIIDWPTKHRMKYILGNVIHFCLGSFVNFHIDFIRYTITLLVSSHSLNCVRLTPLDFTTLTVDRYFI